MRGHVLVPVLAALALLAPVAAKAGQPLTPGIVDAFSGPDASLTLDRAKAAGATAVVLVLSWATVAPQQPANPTDPADPSYDWESIDTPVELAVSKGLTPIVRVIDTPRWAQLSPNPDFPLAGQPSATAFEAFVKAAVARFSGSFEGLPHVRYWECWNEPNLSVYLKQFQGTKPVSPAIYRDMLNRFYSVVHGASPDNYVVAGMTAPFRDVWPGVFALTKSWGPLTFMRRLLCLSSKLRPTCSMPARFDIWATHPYTSGDPHHHAQLPDDVSLGDLSRMRATLLAGIKAHHVLSQHPVQFWIDEFSWDSNPPDPAAVPMKLLRRWVAEAQYQAWSNGVTLFAWYSVADQPLTPHSWLQSGLYFNAPSAAAEKQKPILEAFRFPTVAYRRAAGIYVWGRTPAARPGRVLIEQTFAAGWKRLGIVRTDANGIFEVTYPSPAHKGYVRASLLGAREQSVPFSLVAPPDHFYDPFGQVGCREKCP